jgi:hypothetical protein
MLEPRTGRLLVASPLLEDPNFARTVVLICAHGDEGTLGLVLNRPLEASVVDHVAVWSEFCSPPAWIFAGGPVAPSTVLGLARAEPSALGTVFEGDLGLIDLEAPPSTLADRLRGLRLYGEPDSSRRSSRRKRGLSSIRRRAMCFRTNRRRSGGRSSAGSAATCSSSPSIPETPISTNTRTPT